MKFLPLENITYRTRLKEEEIINRLSDHIEPEKKIRLVSFDSGSTKAYEGQINAKSFNIKRIITYRNSFSPRISGVINKDFEGLKISVKMRMHIFVIIFMCFWCCMAVFGCVGVLIEVSNEPEFMLGDLMPFGMLLFGYALALGGFKYESNKSKKDLQRIFEAEIIR